MTMRIAAVLVVSLSLSLASSCSIGPCTLIGCQNTVTIVLTPEMRSAFVVNEPVNAKSCIGTDCQTAVLTNTGGGGSSSSTNPALTLGPNNGDIIQSFSTRLSGAQRVTLELTKNGADAGTADVSGVMFTDFSPNGPGCGPTCQGVSISL